MKFVLKSVFIMLLFVCCASFAQNQKALDLYEKALKANAKQQNTEAIELLKKAIEKDSTFAEAHFKLAQLNAGTQGNEAVAMKHFKNALVLKPDNKDFNQANQYLGGRFLKKGDYSKAKPFLVAALKNAPPNSNVSRQLTRQIETCDFVEKQLQSPQNIQTETVRGLESFAEFAYFPAITADGNQLFFTARSGGGDENLFVAEQTNDGFLKPKSISPKINTENNEGTCSISADGRTLVLTICDGLKSIGGCDLYIATKIGEEWSVPQNLGSTINSAASESQPALSADGRTLYFSSDRGGGIGMKDLYVSKYLGDNEWSIAKNLGKTINTEQDDVSPFMHANGHTLFFASAGHLGMGGLDMFFSELQSEKQQNFLAASTWSKPENLGFPINDQNNQVAMIITSDGKKAFYSNDTKSKVKLYTFNLPDQLFKRFKKADYLKGKVVDAASQKPIGASIELFDLATNQLVEKVNSDPVSGQYTAVLPHGSKYALYVNKEKYFFKSLSFDYTESVLNKGKQVDIQLEAIKTNIVERLNNIFFDSGKDILREESSVELQKLLDLMQNNPSIKIEIAGHTDDVGSEQTNQQLSQRRALAVVNYLQQKNIDINRLRSVGYGESKPLQPNNSEENRQINRRIEMRIL